MITLNARYVTEAPHVDERRDPRGNKDLELALAAGVETLIASGHDLLVLHPWRGIDILTRAQYLARVTPGGAH